MRPFLLFILMLGTFTAGAQQLPYPDNDQLYTEYSAIRTAPYLKKGLSSKGYIVMNGQNRFLFKQTEPVTVTIKKTGDEIQYQKGAMKPVILSADMFKDPLLFFFDRSITPSDDFIITHQTLTGQDIFTIVPKKGNSFKQVIITTISNIAQSIQIVFNDQTTLTYSFFNTVTGTPPDEAYFN